jgi:hypothetical protein
MTDRFFGLKDSGGLGQNPITPGGKVVINGFLSVPEIRNRKSKMNEGNSFFGGSSDDAAFTIYPKELCFIQRDIANRKKTGNSDLLVTSVLNGGFRPDQTVEEIIESIDVAGITTGPGLKYDSFTDESDSGISLSIGGLTTIVNNGDKYIGAGDLVFWNLPSIKNPYDKSNNGSRRITLSVEPYRPDIHQVTESNLKCIISDPKLQKNESMGQIVQSAKLFSDTIRTSVILALHVLASSGIVKVDMDALTDEDTRNQNSMDFLQDENVRLTIYNQLAVGLGLIDSSNPESKMNFKLNGSSKYTKLSEYAIDVFMGEREECGLFSLNPGNKTIPEGAKGLHMKKQRGWIADQIAAIERGNMYYKRRIIGKAITPSDPGKEFDLIMGHYSY